MTPILETSLHIHLSIDIHKMLIFGHVLDRLTRVVCNSLPKHVRIINYGDATRSQRFADLLCSILDLPAC